MQITVADITAQRIFLGWTGENKHVQFSYDFSGVFAEYPDAAVGLTIQPPTGECYPHTITRDGDAVAWEVLASDCAIAGDGVYQFTFTQGEHVVKSFKGFFTVRESLTGSGEAPTPVANWIADAEAALFALTGMTARAETLAPDAEATATIVEENGRKVIVLGVPQGKQGDKGDVGATPRFTIGTVTTLPPTESATVTITGTPEDPVLNLGIPQGIQGVKGDKGDAFTYADFTPEQKAELVQGPIKEAQTEAVTAVNNAGTVQVKAVNDAGAAQVKAVQDKGQEVRESIPHDYSALTEDVNSLKSAITINEQELVITFDPNSSGKIINASGSVVSSPGFHYTNLISVLGGECIVKYTNQNGGLMLRVHGYNASGEWVKQLWSKSITNGSGEAKVELDEGIVYIRMNCPEENFSVSITNVLMAGDACAILDNKIDDVKDDLEEEIGRVEDKADIIREFATSISWDSASTNKNISADGSIGISPDYHYTELIRVYPGKMIVFGEYTGTITTVRIHGYDAGGVWDEQLYYTTEIPETGCLITIPDDIAYIRISAPTKISNWGLLIGDDISQWTVDNGTNFTWDSSSSGHYIAADGTIGNSENFHYSNLTPVIGDRVVVSFNYSGSAVTVRIHGYDKDGVWLANLANATGVTSAKTISVDTSNNDVVYIRLSIPASATDCKLINYVNSADALKTIMLDQREGKTEESYKLRISSLGYIEDTITSSPDDTPQYVLSAVKKRFVKGKPSVPYGWLYIPYQTIGSKCDFYYSQNQLDKPKHIGAMTGVASNIPHAEFEISPLHGDIIRLVRGERNKPMIYNPSTQTTTVVEGLDINPIGWTSGRGGEFGIDGNGNEFFMFGEYTGVQSSVSGYENVYIWKATYPYTDPENWNIVHTFERATNYGAQEVGKVWHVHTVQRDPYTGIWYATTGDTDRSTIWVYSADDGETWTQLIDGTAWESQIARIVCMDFEEDYIWWANDWGTNHSMNRASRLQNGVVDISSRERVAELNKDQSTFAIVRFNYPSGLLVLDCVETGANTTDTMYVEFYSFDDGKVHTVKTIKRLANSTDNVFGFRCECYTLRQPPTDTRIGLGFGTYFYNRMDIDGNNTDLHLWTLFLDIV